MTGADDRDRVSLVVHEVRSPTAALAAIVAALSEGAVDDSSLRRFVALSLAACHSIDRVLGDAALGPLRLEDVDVADVVNEAVGSAALGGARVRVDLEQGPFRVSGDRVRLRQALDNLIENAIAAGGTECEVLVAVHANERAVVVSVSDRGSGIPLAEQERIFEPGIRLGARGDGSGLGLAVVRAVVEAHGGTVAVASVPGDGATFTIALPVVRDQPAGRASST